MPDPDVIEKIRTGRLLPPDGTALIGFDGYIDRIVKLKKNQAEPPLCFESISEFVRHIHQYQNRSVDIALQRIAEKTGGNGPLMAESLAYKGIKVNCIGAFGYPGLHAVFESLSQRCNLVSLTEPAETLAIEFQDGKIMLADTGVFDDLDWERICGVVGEETFTHILQKAFIVGFTNWSGLPKSNNILAGLLSCAQMNCTGKKTFFLDIADPSGKSPEQFNDLFTLMKQSSGCFDITLGLNEKETVFVYNRLFSRDQKSFEISMLTKIIEVLPCFEIVVHNAEWVFVINKNGSFKKITGAKIRDPLILTGAGDNFNAGYCLGKLWGLDSELCAWLGYISAVAYVKNGIPAGLKEIAVLADCIPYNEEEKCR